MKTPSRWLAAAATALMLCALPAQANFHLFRIEQIYTNADGSVQFVVMVNGPNNNENFWSGVMLTATSGQAIQQVAFPTNLPSNTANHRVLIATPGFAALGIVAPDYTIPANFLPIGGGTLNYGGVNQITFGPLPVDGVNARLATGAVTPNLATNFAGATGSVVPAPAVAIANAIEYYHAGFDHYFITHHADEAAILDAGVTIKGWTRTGQTFNVYAAAGATTSPVCRFYIPPALGNSHFYGRGTTECDGTAKKNPSFTNEDPQFFHVILPVAGACPAGTISVYRVFSNRPDANHRYMIDRTLRDQMVNDRHWLAEGDGPDLVVMCVPPATPAAGGTPTPTPAPTPAPTPDPPMPDPPDPYPY